MFGVSRKGLDTAGGGILITPPWQNIINGQDFCYAENLPFCILGQTVTSHGISPHNDAIMITSSIVVFVNNIGVIRSGDIASCGDVATGSNIVFAD